MLPHYSPRTAHGLVRRLAATGELAVVLLARGAVSEEKMIRGNDILRAEVNKMTKTLTFEIPADEAAEIELTLVGLTEAMRIANEHMRQDQLEIERLKKESQQIANETRQIADETRQIADETRQIADETRQIGEQTRQALTQLETTF